MQTDLGGIDLRLRDDVAPLSVANFLDYVNANAYDGTFIHRSIPGFVVQGGGFKFDPANGLFFQGGAGPIPTNPPVVNEAGLPGALQNKRGTVSLAKGAYPDSATSQWFFNLVDNPGLDDPNNAGGFTVFAEVLGDGMDIVDTMSEQDVCRQFNGVAGVICPQTSFGDTIFVGAAGTEFSTASTDTLVLVNNVGADSDGDGIIDRIEDGSPNGGDANNDVIADSTQAAVASFLSGTGDYVTIETPAPVVVQSIDVLGSVYRLVNPPVTFCGLIGLDFTENFMGFDLSGMNAGGTVTATITMPAGQLPDAYYNYGPTTDDPEPHWYVFSFNGETGAEFNGNVITLHFVDGKRGDNDLDNANGIVATSGGPAEKFVFDATMIDDDGVDTSIEDGAPNNGDGNLDGINDSVQGNVASFRDLNGTYLTVETDATVPVQLTSTSVNVPIPDSNIINGQNFAHGFFSFDMCIGAAATVRMILPEGEQPDSYFMFGPTPDNPAPHFYEFLFDGETGAEINGNIITLHFVDGKRGDSDLDSANGVINDPGAPAFKAGTAGGGGGGGGGGCSLNIHGANVLQAGAWWLLLAMFALTRMRKLVLIRQEGKSG